jgi:endonuclease YncB( thermonuclease family)
MRWKLSLLAVLAAAGYLAATAATRDVPSAKSEGSAAEWFTLRGKVTRVVDGDAVIARIGRRNERVRLIGIDAPIEHRPSTTEPLKTPALWYSRARELSLFGERRAVSAGLAATALRSR